MNFGQAITTCFSKYVTFTGRASRPEFWWFFLFQIIVLIVTGMISNILYGIAALAMLLPAIAVGVRRLHDIGKTGWLDADRPDSAGQPVAAVLVRAASEGPNQYDEASAAPAAPAEQ